MVLISGKRMCKKCQRKRSKQIKMRVLDVSGKGLTNTLEGCGDAPCDAFMVCGVSQLRHTVCHLGIGLWHLAILAPKRSFCTLFHSGTPLKCPTLHD